MSPAPASNTRVFKIEGMDCADEVVILRREVGPLVGGEAGLSFDLLKAKMMVAGAEGVSDGEIVAAVGATGMRAQPFVSEVDKSGEATRTRQRRQTMAMILSLGGLVLGFAAHATWGGGVREAMGSDGSTATIVPFVARALYLAAIAGGLWSVLPKAVLALRRLRPDMNLLMTVAVLGAIGIGDWFEGATVSFLFSLSLALESWSVARARRAVEALLDLTPQTARIVENSGERDVPAGEVAVGSRIAIRPGERIALDGRVVAGSSQVNQAPITGESLPVPKSEGDAVFAGSVNGDGALEVETTKPASDTLVAHIIRLVEEAQARRAPSERWVERFARVYTPAVMALAIAGFVVPPLFGATWAASAYRALALLVIACPCALVISTPVSVVAALTAAARNGVLVKGGLFIELPASLRAVALDKTGTLTRGQPAVVEVVPLAGHTEDELIERVSALEARSDHPLARAILAYAKSRGVAVRPAKDFQILQGRGATGQVGGRSYWLGSHRLLEDRAQEDTAVHERIVAMESAGRSVVAVGTDAHLCGLIAIADPVRAESRAAVSALRAAGVRAVVMLTGDNMGTARAVAESTGVEEVHAEMLPVDKVNVIDELLRKYGSVAMIGDGVNDAPAMARATLSVAMGAAGSDAAIETADIALMSDDLARLPWLIGHSRRVVGAIRQNIVFSLAVKAVFVILALAGHASLWAAIAADMGASLLVISNGLRLLRT